MQTVLVWRILASILCLLIQGSSVPPGDDDFAPLLLPLMLILLAICLVLLGIGIVLALVGVACVAVLVALGIVSSAAVVALVRRRAAAGVRALHYQICAATAVPAGVTLLWVAASLFDLEIRLRNVILLGAAGGLAAGLLLAGVLDWTARVVYRRLVSTMSGRDDATSGERVEALSPQASS